VNLMKNCTEYKEEIQSFIAIMLYNIIYVLKLNSLNTLWLHIPRYIIIKVGCFHPTLLSWNIVSEPVSNLYKYLHNFLETIKHISHHTHNNLHTEKRIPFNWSMRESYTMPKISKKGKDEQGNV